jgi:hypothetical protein
MSCRQKTVIYVIDYSLSNNIVIFIFKRYEVIIRTKDKELQKACGDLLNRPGKLLWFIIREFDVRMGKQWN